MIISPERLDPFADGKNCCFFFIIPSPFAPPFFSVYSFMTPPPHVQPFDHNAITGYPDLMPSLRSILCGHKYTLSLHIFFIQFIFVCNFVMCQYGFLSYLGNNIVSKWHFCHSVTTVGLPCFSVGLWLGVESDYSPNRYGWVISCVWVEGLTMSWEQSRLSFGHYSVL